MQNTQSSEQKKPDTPQVPKMPKPVVGQFDKNRRKLNQMAKNSKKGQK